MVNNLNIYKYKIIIGNEIWVENPASKNSIKEDPYIIVNIFLFKKENNIKSR